MRLARSVGILETHGTYGVLPAVPGGAMAQPAIRHEDQPVCQESPARPRDGPAGELENPKLFPLRRLRALKR